MKLSVNLNGSGTLAQPFVGSSVNVAVKAFGPGGTAMPTCLLVPIPMYRSLEVRLAPLTPAIFRCKFPTKVVGSTFYYHVDTTREQDGFARGKTRVGRKTEVIR